MYHCPHAVRTCQMNRHRGGAVAQAVAIVVAALLIPAISLGDTTNVFSPPVCYQHAEGMSAAPVVSYQYPAGIVPSPTVTFSYPEGMFFAPVVSDQRAEGVAFPPVVSYYYQLVVDSVGDGIPDMWRARYFGGYGTTTNGQSCATCDPDHDGMNNLQEYVAGTDPTNPASFFCVTAVSNLPPSGMPGFAVQWSSVTGKCYYLDRSSNLLANPPFNFNVATNIPATPPLNSQVDTNAAGNGPCFYRIRVQ